MSKVVTYITALFLSFLIFYGGAGINLISYCCGDCRSAGVEVVLSDKCCEIHDHSHGKEAHHDHTNCHHHDPVNHTEEEGSHLCETDCCDLERVEFEWNNNSYTVEQPAPVELDLSLFGLASLTFLTSLDKEEDILADQYSPPLIRCPRVYLSLLTTLLI